MQEGMREVSNIASRHNQTFLGGDAVENIILLRTLSKVDRVISFVCSFWMPLSPSLLVLS
jgi:hypothetical protein